MSQSDEGSHILAAQDNEEERRKRLFKVCSVHSKHSYQYIHAITLEQST
jgi:hypothetical protein